MDKEDIESMSKEIERIFAIYFEIQETQSFDITNNAIKNNILLGFLLEKGIVSKEEWNLKVNYFIDEKIKIENNEKRLEDLKEHLKLLIK